MKKHAGKLLAILLAAAMLVSLFALPAYAADTATDITVTSAGYTITADGTYHLKAGSTGVLKIASGVTKVTIVGNGAAWDSKASSSTYGTVSSVPYENLSIDCSAAAGITLILRDLYISNSGVEFNAVNFSGAGNKLIYDGTIILDMDNGANGYASIHVPAGSKLTIHGTSGSSAYLYKREQAAGIGGNYMEACGEITFGIKNGANDFCFYMKGSKQGAVIGNGANCSAVPGNITFYSGVYNLLSVSRGAILSGSAGVSSKDAGNVYVYGGLINFNVDYSGAAIGGGGYSSGNDKGGGCLYVSGGSIRTYIDSNAVFSWSSYGVTTNGVNDAVITAARLNPEGEDVYLLTVDTSKISASSYTIAVDGTTWYTGGRYGYCYYMEDTNRDTDGDGLADISTAPEGTPGNWVTLNEPCFYLYVTGENHVVTVNGTQYSYTWNEAASTFTPNGAYGDVNGDGSIDSTDAAMVYRCANGKMALTGTKLIQADVNRDGNIDSIDAALIYRCANGKLTQFPLTT